MKKKENMKEFLNPLNKQEPKIRDLKKEIKDLGFDEEQSKKILEWVDTIPIRVYGSDINVEVKQGVVRVNENSVDFNSLSFNDLPEDLRLHYMWDNGKLRDPFNLPDEMVLYNPFTGEAFRHNRKTGTKEIPTDLNGEVMMHNPFNTRISGKILYENGIPIKRWIVNEDNEWEEKELEKPHGLSIY